MNWKKKTAVLYLYCGEHAGSRKNFCNFVTFEFVKNVDYFLTGSKINLSETTFKQSQFKHIYSDNSKHVHQKISRFYREHIKNSDYQSLVVVSSKMSGPHSMPGCDQDWVQRFTKRLTTQTHLVGSTIVIMPPDHPLTKIQNKNKGKFGVAPYVPNLAFAISREALDFLDTKCFFDQKIPNCELSMQLLSEMRMSDLLLENGWEISCLLSKYSDVDFRSAKKDPNPSSWIGDPSKEGCYFGGSINKHECVFVETPNFETGCSDPNIKPPKNTKLFGIFYDKPSLASIADGFIPLDNSKGPKYLYESFPILRQLERTPPDEGDWYGFFSPKFTEKTGITPNDIFGEIERADKDVSVLLFSSHWKQVSMWPNIWLQGNTYHPGLFHLTEKVIKLAQYEIDITKIYSTLNDGVFSNYLVAKAEFWSEWRRLVSIYYELVQANENLLKQSTPYQGEAVPIHTFVIERLATVVILELGLKTKFSPSLYNKSLDFTTVDGSEAIKLNHFKTKYIETGDHSYLMLYTHHVNKINERNKRNLTKRLLLKKLTGCVA